MSDGRTVHAGIWRSAMKALVEMLRNDSTIIENDVRVVYRLDHPSKQIRDNTHKFTMEIEPAGVSQTTGAGALDLQYYTWIKIRCRPFTLGEDEEDRLTFICEYLHDLLHKKMIGGMSTYAARALIMFKSCDVGVNHRTVEIKLADDEIGALVWIWQSPKTIQQIDAENVNEYEGSTPVKIESGSTTEGAGS